MTPWGVQAGSGTVSVRISFAPRRTAAFMISSKDLSFGMYISKKGFPVKPLEKGRQ
jgi:hypothetical protein